MNTSSPAKLENDQISTNENIEMKLAGLTELIDSASTIQADQLTDQESVFQRCLLDHLKEGAIFVDHKLEITLWNRNAEEITGLSTTNMLGTEFSATLLGLSESDCQTTTGTCPVQQCLETKETVELNTELTGRSGRSVSVELRAIPVIQDSLCLGCVILILDRSINAELQRQLSDLQNASSLDPLTRVANRAEFDKRLREYVSAHRSTNTKCSLIIGDIDFFKMVNDTYGHNVGDQALIAFSQTLKQFVRSRDIVARYGGEEFVILCANCDLDSAAERAEKIRMSLNRTPQAMLDGKTMSASFGVAELLDDEEVTDFFVRADNALYTAKENGRNRVQCASKTMPEQPSEPEPAQEVSVATGVQWRKQKGKVLVTQEYQSSTSADMLAEKLRGFITESGAKILKIEPSYASVEVVAVDPANESKRTPFRVDIEFYEPEHSEGAKRQTFIRITVYPPKRRMFGRVHEDLHTVLMTHLRSFFMLTDDNSMVKLNPAATTSGRK